MTFCVGIKVAEVIVTLADTQIVLGSERISKQKLAALSHADDSLFAMTSGLRSVRAKATIYLNEELEQQLERFDRLFRVVNRFSDQLTRTAKFISMVASRRKPYGFSTDRAARASPLKQDFAVLLATNSGKSETKPAHRWRSAD